VCGPVSPLLSDVLRMAAPAQPAYCGRGVRVMTAPATVRGRDLHALAAIVSQARPDLPDGEGLPPSLLADLKDQIRCDVVSLDRGDGRQAYSILQSIPALSDDELKAFENLDPARWEHWSACRWECRCCTYPRAHRRPA
jgi:hypothetical protein